jgi:serine phosphatase RsbU (regulator of sigma subunit)
MRDRPAAEIVHRIVAEVRGYEGETGPADDITMLEQMLEWDCSDWKM